MTSTKRDRRVAARKKHLRFMHKKQFHFHPAQLRTLFAARMKAPEAEAQSKPVSLINDFHQRFFLNKYLDNSLGARIGRLTDWLRFAAIITLRRLRKRIVLS